MTKQTNIKVYETAIDLLEECGKQPFDAAWAGYRSSHNEQNDSGAKWYGSDSYDHAKSLALHGWEKGLKDISGKIAVVTSEFPARVTLKDICGNVPDIGRFLANMPDCMNRRVHSESARKPIVSIMVNASYSGSISAEHIMNYGAAIACLVDSLENAGYSVMLRASSTSLNYEGVNQGFIINVKNHGEYLDMGKVAFFLAHPSFLRRIAFAHWEVNNTKASLYSGYGMISDIPKDMQEDAVYFGKQGSLCDCASMEGALKSVMRKLKEQRPDMLEDTAMAA